MSITPSPVPSTREAVIIGGNRIPFSRAGKKYVHIGNRDLFTAALEGLIARFGLSGERLGEVAGGAVLKHSKNFNLIRECVLGSSLSPTTAAYDVQQACATGLEAAIAVTNKIKLGQIESAIAGGTDTVSDAPIVVSDQLRGALLDANRAATTSARLKALLPILSHPRWLAPRTPGTNEPRTHLSMGEHQAITTALWGITREEQDKVAFDSHQNLARAWESGFFDDLVTPYRGLTRDDNLRPDSSLEKLGTLKPVFGTTLAQTATMTAGNSTPLTDGASAVLFSSHAWAEERSLPILARFVDAETTAIDFVHGHEGLLMAPAAAVPRLLARHGLSLDDIDFFEIHEAFASTVLTTLAAWKDENYCRTELGLDGAFGEIDRRKLNVNGSSLAAGHPFAATGGRIIATAAKLVAQKSTETGQPARALISICAAGGLGAAALIESA